MLDMLDMLDKRTPDRQARTSDTELSALAWAFLTLLGLVGPACLLFGSFVVGMLAQYAVSAPYQYPVSLAILIGCPLTVGFLAMLKSTYLGSLMALGAIPSGVVLSQTFSFGVNPIAVHLWDGLSLAAPLIVGVLAGWLRRRRLERRGIR